jgi:hypothetical protein
MYRRQGRGHRGLALLFFDCRRISQDFQDFSGLTGLKTKKLYALIL